MNKEKVGKTINRYTDVLTNEECDFLFNYTKEQTNNPVEDSNKVPWELEKSNTLFYPTIADEKVREILNKYKHAIAKDLSEDFEETIYPHLTTLVLWKPGQKMPRHVDDGNGYAEREQTLGMRFVASITYLNDDYQGGNTFVKNDGVNDHSWRGDSLLSFPNNTFEDYISIPEKGATITFLSDDSNAHGVTEVEGADRVILSTWFTKDSQYQERDDLYISPEQKKEMIEKQEQLQQQQAQGMQQSW